MNSYRFDIDGLRALAVLVVIGFHLDISLLAGGHVGVDIFFVLSGFLITSILFTQLKNHSFSAKTFYIRRIRRLFPALYATIALSFIAAVFILQPDDFERFCRSVIASVFSVSNFLFWRESGYWDVSSDTKVLLHTWSLGVEEQFYLLWPSMLLLIWKLRLDPVKSFLAIATVGFIFCYLHTEHDPSAAFYLLPARFFQFAVGGFLATLVNVDAPHQWLDSKFINNLLFVLGIFLIFFASVSFDAVTYPGAYALVPTIGALLVLMAGSGSNGQRELGRYLLENKFVVWVGRLSYSLYLVHWPIIVLYRYVTGPEFSVAEKAMLLTVTFLAGTVMHYAVERRLYARRFIPQLAGSRHEGFSQEVKFTLASGFALSCIAGLAWNQGGWVWRFENLIYTPEKIELAKNARFVNYPLHCQIWDWPDGRNCTENKMKTILFFGNSHEPDGLNFVSAGYPDQLALYRIVLFGTINDCQDLVYVNGHWRSENKSCQARLDNLFDKQFLNKLSLIVYSAHYTFLPWSNQALEIIQDLKAANSNIKVVAFSDYIETKVPCVKLLNESGTTSSCFSEENIAYAPFDYKSQELYIDFHHIFDTFIDRMKLLCTGAVPQTCQAASVNGTPYSFDTHHISLDFSEMSGKLYAKENPALLSKLL
jgi:peptidoglycan/LPS O-acetylase OafA/YrhL